VSRAMALRLATMACEGHGAPAVAALRTLAELVDRRPNSPPTPGLVPVDVALAVVVGATMSTIEDVIVALLEVRTHHDVAYRSALLDWAPKRMSAAVSGAELPPMPTRPEVVDPVVEWPGRDSQPPRSNVQDAEIINLDDENDDEPDDDPADLVDLRAEVARLRTAVGAS
jgi:hypothetical protein